MWKKIYYQEKTNLATPHPRSGVVAKRSYPTSKFRGGSREELPHIQGKKQWMCFAGPAMKRYPTSKVGETIEKWQALRESIRGQTG